MSTFVQNITGNFDLAQEIDFSQETGVYSKQQISLQCDTSGGPVNVLLPEIASLRGFQNLKVIVNDVNGNAGTNPITVTARGVDKVDTGTNVQVTINDGAVVLLIGGTQKWISSSAGSGTIPTPFIVGSINVNNTIVGQPFNADRPYPVANAGNAFNIVITNPGQDKGMIGGTAGAGGLQVEDGDIIYAVANSPGGDQATAGGDFLVWEGETLQLWENGTATAPNSIRQINLASPNTADGDSSVVMGVGNSVTGGSDATANLVQGQANSVDGTNGNGANANTVNGQANTIVDTVNSADSNMVGGISGTLDGASANMVSGISNTLDGSIGNGVNANMVTGVSNTLSDTTDGPSANMVGGVANTLDSTNTSIVSGTANILDGTAGSGTNSNTVNGISNTLLDSVNDETSNNVVHGNSNSITQGQRNAVNGLSNILVGGEIGSVADNIVGGQSNTLTQVLRNVVSGISNSVTNSGNGASDNILTGSGNAISDVDSSALRNIMSGNGNILDSASDNIMSGGENTINGEGANVAFNIMNGTGNLISGTDFSTQSNIVTGQGNSVTDGTSNAVLGNSATVAGSASNTPQANLVSGKTNTITADTNNTDSNILSGFQNDINGGEGGPANNNIVSGTGNFLGDSTESVVSGVDNVLTGPTQGAVVFGESNTIGFGSDFIHVEGSNHTMTATAGGNGSYCHVEGDDNEITPHPTLSTQTIYARLWGTFARAIYPFTTFFSGGGNGIGAPGAHGESQTMEWDFGGNEPFATTPVLIGGNGGSVTDSQPVDTAWRFKCSGVIVSDPQTSGLGDGGVFDAEFMCINDSVNGVDLLLSFAATSGFNAGSASISLFTTATGTRVEVGGGLFDGKGTIHQVGYGTYS